MLVFSLTRSLVFGVLAMWLCVHMNFINQSAIVEASQQMPPAGTKPLQVIALATEIKSTITNLRLISESAADRGARALLIAGDMTSGGTDNEWKALMTYVKKAPLPIQLVPGNHDFSWRVVQGRWEAPFGNFQHHTGLKPNRTFDLGSVRFIALTYIDPSQRHHSPTYWLDFLEQALTESDKEDHLTAVCILMHQPANLWHDPNNEALLSVAERVLLHHKPVLWLSGEIGKFDKHFRIRSRYHWHDIMPSGGAHYCRLLFFKDRIIAEHYDAQNDKLLETKKIIYQRTIDTEIGVTLRNAMKKDTDIAHAAEAVKSLQDQRPLMALAVEKARVRFAALAPYKDHLQIHDKSRLLGVRLASYDTPINGRGESLFAGRNHRRQVGFGPFRVDRVNARWFDHLEALIKEARKFDLTIAVHIVDFGLITQFGGRNSELLHAKKPLSALAILAARRLQPCGDNVMLRPAYMDVPYGAPVRIVPQTGKIVESISQALQFPQ